MANWLATKGNENGLLRSAVEIEIKINYWFEGRTLKRLFNLYLFSFALIVLALTIVVVTALIRLPSLGHSMLI